MTQHPQNPNSPLEDTIERLIDTHGPEAIFDTLAEICLSKAEHVTLHWGDHILAAHWERIATKASEIAEEISTGGI